jgi:UDP-N-acetylglucosamine transferase subunit ALG13
MILVTTGSSGAPFDRLISVIERLEARDEEIVVQHGPSKIRPSGATCVDFLPFERLSELVRTARVVVAHAGVGSILLCLTWGQAPVVVPRQSRYGEVIDDHQLMLARRLVTLGAVTCVEDANHLPEVVRTHRRLCRNANVVGEPTALVADLNRYLDSVLDNS